MSIKALTNTPSDETDATISRALASLPGEASRVDSNVVNCYLEGVFYFHLRNQLALALRCSTAATSFARRSNDDDLLNRALRYEATIRTESGDTTGAVERSLEARELAQRSCNVVSEVGAWNSLGAALISVDQYQAALLCFERAAAAAKGQGGQVETVPSANISLCALWLKRHSVGIEHAERAISLNGAPKAPDRFLSRVAAEALLARHLLSEDLVQQAKVHAERARFYAAGAMSTNAQSYALLACALVDVRLGETLAATEALLEALQLARAAGPMYLKGVLWGCVEGFEAAGDPERALQCLQEWIALRQSHAAHQVAVRRSAAITGLETSDLELSDSLGANDMTRLRGKVDQQFEHLAEMCVNAGHCAGYDLYRVFRLGKLAELLSSAIGLGDAEVAALSWSAKLADIGMVAIPGTILLRPGPLTPAEMEIVGEHTRIGSEILESARLRNLEFCISAARFHHERWDGKGRFGLKELGIPLAARVVAICDVFDALTHIRPWRAACNARKALTVLEDLSGSQFDPSLVRSFVRLVQELELRVPSLETFLTQDSRDSDYVLARERLSVALGVSDQADAVVRAGAST